MDVYTLTIYNPANYLEPETFVFSSMDNLEQSELSFLRQVYHQAHWLEDEGGNYVSPEDADLKFLREQIDSDYSLSQVPGGWRYTVEEIEIDAPLSQI